jgi:hypothetical protein
MQKLQFTIMFEDSREPITRVIEVGSTPMSKLELWDMVVKKLVYVGYWSPYWLPADKINLDKISRIEVQGGGMAPTQIYESSESRLMRDLYILLPSCFDDKFMGLSLEVREDMQKIVYDPEMLFTGRPELHQEIKSIERVNPAFAAVVMGMLRSEPKN